MAVYTNNLKLKEIADGAESGSWGASTNTNLDLIAQAFGYASYNGFSSDANATVTVQNSGATEEFTRSMYVKITSSATLSTTRTLTIAPNNISRVLFIENATTGSQTINISQGSGANVAIPTGKRKCIYLDGAGSGAAVVEVFDSFEVKDSFQISGATPTLTIGDGDQEDAKIVFDGNAQDFYLGLDDSDDTLSLGTGSAIGSGERLNISSSEVKLTDGSNLITINDSDGNGVKVQSDDAIQLVVERTSNSPAVIAFSTDEISKTAKIEASLSHGIRFYTNNTANFKVKHDGDLDVTNDLRFETNGKGVILTSPNGTKYRIAVDNSGNLSTSSV